MSKLDLMIKKDEEETLAISVINSDKSWCWFAL